MQPVLPSLPKLNPFGHNPQPAPELRHRNVLGPRKPLLRLLNPPLKLPPPIIPLSPRPQDPTLLARPRAQPTPPHPRLIINLTFLTLQPLRLALNPDLPLQRLPPEHQTRPLVGLQVRGLARGAEIGVDDETFGVELLEVDNARADAARRQAGRGKRAGFGVGDLGALRLGRLEPGVELGHGRGGVQVGPFEAAVGFRLGELFGLRVGC